MELEDFSPLGKRMARIVGRLCTIDPRAAPREDLEWCVRASRALRGVADAREGLVTARLEQLLHQPEPDPSPVEEPPAAEGPPDDLGLGATSGPVGEGSQRETAQEYRQRLRRSKWLVRLPMFADALQGGALTTAHIDGLANVLDFVEPTVVAEVLADEAHLLDVARTGTSASFTRYLRGRIDTIRDDGGTVRLQRQIDDSFGVLGTDDDLDMHELFVKLDPVRGARVCGAIRQRVDELRQSGEMSNLRRGQLVAQAVCDLICGTATADRDGGELIVITDAATLLRGRHPGSLCETGDGLSIPVDLARDLCRRAGTTITAAVTDGSGTVLAVGERTVPPPLSSAPTPRSRTDATDDRPPAHDLTTLVDAALSTASAAPLRMGRRIRLANQQQRRALRAMYRTCVHPSCRVRFADCFVHHTITWDDGGPTDLDVLVPVCSHHHHQIHDRRWRLTIDPARTLRWYRPDGTLDCEVALQPLGPSPHPRTWRGGRAGGGPRAPAAAS